MEIIHEKICELCTFNSDIESVMASMGYIRRFGEHFDAKQVQSFVDLLDCREGIAEGELIETASICSAVAFARLHLSITNGEVGLGSVAQQPRRESKLTGEIAAIIQRLRR